jgi:hypothetical protein
MVVWPVMRPANTEQRTIQFTCFDKKETMGNCLTSGADTAPSSLTRPGDLPPSVMPIIASVPTPATAQKVEPELTTTTRRIPQYQNPPIPQEKRLARTKAQGPKAQQVPTPPARAPIPPAAAVSAEPSAATFPQHDETKPYVLFFPDPALPCRFYLAGQACMKKRGCNFAHTVGLCCCVWALRMFQKDTRRKAHSRCPQPTSLTRFLHVLCSAKKTLDICVFTITCDEVGVLVHRDRVRACVWLVPGGHVAGLDLSAADRRSRPRGAQSRRPCARHHRCVGAGS